MAVMIAQVANDSDTPVPITPLGTDSFYATRSGILAPSAGQETLVDISKPAVIEILEIAGSARNAPQVRIFRRKQDGTLDNLVLMKANGSSGLPLLPGEIQNHGCAIFDIVVYDDTSASYKFVLNRPLAFPNGFRVTVANAAATDQNIGATIYGRLLK